MSLLATVLLGLAIGAVLGGLGGGGAILTVPALVYVVGQPAQQATTSSLVIVGATALVAMASYVSSRRVRWKIGVAFGVTGVPAAYVGSYLNHQVDEDYLLLGFSLLMVVAATAMARGTRTRSSPPAARRASESARPPAGERSPSSTGGTLAVKAPHDARKETRRRTSWVGVAAAGLAVGLLTGFFGVGGGFVVVPALVIALGLPMQQAVGTSLLIVAANSATSLAARVGSAQVDWAVIVPFTVAAMAATLVGKVVADRLPARQLKAGFAALLVAVAGYTAVQSVQGLGDASAGSSGAGEPSSHAGLTSPPQRGARA